MTMRPDDHRRKWNKNEYEKLAQERLLNQAAPKDEGRANIVPSISRESINRALLILF